jgi:hypothetical protein
MPVTLITQALITEDEYKEQGSGIDASDPTQDDAIRFCINNASLRIMEYAGREFKSAASGSTLRTFQITPGGCGFDEVSFGPYDAQNVTAVTIDTQLGQTGLTLTTSQYQPVPVQAWHGVFTGLHILSGATGYVPLGVRRAVSVTGTWGWPSVPGHIKGCCVETVKEWLGGEYQVQGGDITAALMAASLQLPARVRATLDATSQVLIA